jgi:hypothetical protein
MAYATYCATHIQTAEVSVKRMNPSSCSAAKVTYHFVRVFTSFPVFFHFGRFFLLLHHAMQTNQTYPPIQTHKYLYQCAPIAAPKVRELTVIHTHGPHK